MRKAYCPGLFWGLFAGCFSASGPSPKHKKRLNREADEAHLSNYITSGKLIPKTRLITLHPEINLKTIKRYKCKCNFREINSKIVEKCI